MANYTGQVLSMTKDGNTYIYDVGNIHYGVCDTAAATQAKTVSIPEITALTAGLCVRVKFVNAQTYNGAPTLNLSSLGAKSIYRNGTTAAAQYEWQADEVLDFVYDGTGWIMLEGAVPTTTYYGGRVKLSSLTNSTSETLAATPKAVKDAYDLANGKVSCTAANVQTALGINTSSTDDLFLKKDGTFAEVAAKPITVTLSPITTTGGSYINTWSNTDTAKITSDMSLVWYECPNMSLFASDISVITGNGSIQLTCSNTVAGTTSMTVRVM